MEGNGPTDEGRRFGCYRARSITADRRSPILPSHWKDHRSLWQGSEDGQGPGGSLTPHEAGFSEASCMIP